MTWSSPIYPPKPAEEHFAAYADGELRGEDLVRMEEWLCAHPQDALRVEAQQQPAALCRRAAPPEPTEAEWTVALEKIETGLEAAAVRGAEESEERRRVRRVRRIRVAALASAAAAAVALAFYSGAFGERANHPDPTPAVRLTKVQAPGRPERESVEEDLAFLHDPTLPMLFLSSDDVDILSLDGGDDSAIVVGAPPVGQTFSLVSPGDVVVRSVAADVDGVVPELRAPPGPAAVPMIVAPMK